LGGLKRQSIKRLENIVLQYFFADSLVRSSNVWERVFLVLCSKENVHVCASRKLNMDNHRKESYWKLQGGGERVSKAKHVKGKYEPNFEVWGGWREGLKQKTLSLWGKTHLGGYGWRNFLSIRSFGNVCHTSWYTTQK